MFFTKPTPLPSPAPAPEPNDVFEIHFKLSGDTLTKLIFILVSIATLGSAGLNYFQPPSSPMPPESTPTLQERPEVTTHPPVQSFAPAQPSLDWE